MPIRGHQVRIAESSGIFATACQVVLMIRAFVLSLCVLGAANAMAVPIMLDEMDIRPVAPRIERLDVDFTLVSVFENEGPQAIVNGNNSGNNEFPEVVALAVVDPWGFGDSFCSGTLINHTWVVTAAHCVDDVNEYVNNGYGLYVMWGTSPFGNHLTDYIEMERWIPHPDYEPNSQNIRSDIGLVELKSPKLNGSIMTVNDDAINNNWMGYDMTFVGYGITSDNANDGGRQRNTSMPIFSYDSQFVYAYDGTFDGWGNPYYDSTTNLCSGDSGGAGLVPYDGGWQLVGVNSFTVGNCVGGYAGDTRVDKFLGWVEGYTEVYRDSDDIPPDPDPPDDVEPDVEEAFNPDEPPSDGGGWGEPVRPTGKDLYVGSACSVAGAGGLGGWWIVLAVAALRRRR